MLFIETFIFIGRRRDSHAPLRGQYQFSSRLTTLFANLEGIQIRKQAGDEIRTRDLLFGKQTFYR